MRRLIYLAALPLLFDVLVALLLAAGEMPGQAPRGAPPGSVAGGQGVTLAFFHWDHGSSVN